MKDGKIKIAVFVSGGGTNLQALINAEKKGILKSGKIELVISNNAEAYALTRAEKAGIRSEVVLKKDFPDENAFERRLMEILTENRTELIILAGFMLILSENFIKRYPDRIINIHPSLIPAFCGRGFYGLKVHREALSYGVKVSGATVHFVNEIPDGGKIIMQKAVKIREDDTPETLQNRVMRLAEHKILPLAAEKVCKDIKEKERQNGCL